MFKLGTVNDEMSKQTINEILEKFDFSKLYEDDEIDREQCNVWIPIEYKGKYARIQTASKKKFSKLLSEVVCLVIDKADAAQPKAS